VHVAAPLLRAQQASRGARVMPAPRQVSKLCNVLFSNELARRLQGTGVVSNSLHPGVVATDVWRQLPGCCRCCIKKAMLTVEEGAATTLHVALAPECATVTGSYFDASKEVRPSALALDAELARALWGESARLIAEVEGGKDAAYHPPAPAV
jgi:retinol dehydrogenase 12